MTCLPCLRRCAWIVAALALAAACMVSGCAGYSVGSMLPGNIKTVFVPNLTNQTGEPDIENMATDALIEAFQKDGTLNIAGPGNADAVLVVTLTSVELKPLQYSKSKSTEVSEYRLTLFANMKLKERETGKTIVEYTLVSGKTSFELLGDFATAKEEAIPDASKDLAHQIVNRVAEAW
jgi:hypothetical protein